MLAAFGVEVLKFLRLLEYSKGRKRFYTDSSGTNENSKHRRLPIETRPTIAAIALTVLCGQAEPVHVAAWPSTNPHDKTKSTDSELRFTLAETPKKGSLSIYSTNLYRGVIIPVFGNRSIGLIVRAGGCD